MTQNHWTKPQIKLLTPTPELAERLRTKARQSIAPAERAKLQKMADAVDELIQHRTSQQTRKVA
jgi:hypothetical protein